MGNTINKILWIWIIISTIYNFFLTLLFFKPKKKEVPKGWGPQPWMTMNEWRTSERAKLGLEPLPKVTSYSDFFKTGNENVINVIQTTLNRHLFDSKKEAKEFVDECKKIVLMYNNVTVADVYDMLDITSSYAHNKYGWRSADSFLLYPAYRGLKREEGKYYVGIPKAEYLEVKER